MEWENQEEAEGRVEDRRGMRPAVAVGGGIGALIITALVAFGVLDKQQGQQLAQVVGGSQQQQQGAGKPINDENLKFADQIMVMTDRIWSEQFKLHGKTYEKPKMVLFSESVNTGCGHAPSAVGPFYCPADRTVYLDPTFFDELEKKLGGSKAPFSKAYVIAHEVGHHVQNLRGYNTKIDEFRSEGDNAGIRLELQADYLAGVWAHYAGEHYKNLIKNGDVEEAIKTARNIGDDAIQKRMQGWVSPERFNHGKSAQRLKYFMLGYKTGDASAKALDHFFRHDIKPLDL